jgi:hypothetical protein
MIAIPKAHVTPPSNGQAAKLSPAATTAAVVIPTDEVMSARSVEYFTLSESSSTHEYLEL